MHTGLKPKAPAILQIYREPLRSGPGIEEAYDALEMEQARVSAEFGCPHPYLGAASLSGPRETWWFNAYDSTAEMQKVYDAYAKNTPLMTALQRNSQIKADLTLAPIEVFAKYRADLSAGDPWTIGDGRFLVITLTKRESSIRGTVFEAPDGVRFIVQTAGTRDEAEATRALAGPEAVAFAVRPSWSFPDKSWIAADPAFWQQDSGTIPDGSGP